MSKMWRWMNWIGVVVLVVKIVGCALRKDWAASAIWVWMLGLYVMRLLDNLTADLRHEQLQRRLDGMLERDALAKMLREEIMRVRNEPPPIVKRPPPPPTPVPGSGRPIIP